MTLLGCLKGLFFGFACHPFAVCKQCDDPERNDEDNAEYQDHARLSAGPISSLCDGDQAAYLGAGVQGNGGHLGPNLRVKIGISCVGCQSCFSLADGLVWTYSML